MNRAAVAGLMTVFLGLSACQPQDPNGAPAAPPADAPAPTPANDFSGPITVLGTEPFWSVKIDGTRLTLTRPDQPELAATAPGAAISAGQAAWTAKTPDGRTLVVTLKTGDCSDGMSDRRYPMTAEAVLAGDTLRGCAIPSADLRPE